MQMDLLSSGIALKIVDISVEGTKQEEPDWFSYFRTWPAM
jgi:hypothetical protein